MRTPADYDPTLPEQLHGRLYAAFGDLEHNRPFGELTAMVTSFASMEALSRNEIAVMERFVHFVAREPFLEYLSGSISPYAKEGRSE